MSDRKPGVELAAEALARGSFIRPAPERYTRYYGQGPNQEPSQNNEDMRLVFDTLKLIGRDIDQVDITAGHTAILIGDAGDRVTILLEPWDTPELLQPRLAKALEKMPVRWAPEQVARDLTVGLALEAEVDSPKLFGPPEKKLRIERGGLE